MCSNHAVRTSEGGATCSSHAHDLSRTVSATGRGGLALALAHTRRDSSVGIIMIPAWGLEVAHAEVVPAGDVTAGSGLKHAPGPAHPLSLSPPSRCGRGAGGDSGASIPAWGLGAERAQNANPD